jgi:hypothetical protein
MQIIDLTTQYIHSVVHQDNPDSYESSFPHLFEHYYRFWAPRGTYFYRDVKEIQRRRKRIVERLAFLENRFLSKGLVLDQLVTVLFVGRGTSNGHAFPFGEKWVVWLPVESYPSSFTIDVFASHEIGHALHYQKRPEFFFDTEEEKTNVFRQVVTEGIATLTSKYVLEISDQQALWADYLPPEQCDRWYRQCLLREAEILQTVAEKLEISDNGLFSFTGDQNVLQNRAGYYAALKLIHRILHENKLSLPELLKIEKQTFFKMIQALLKNQPP